MISRRTLFGLGVGAVATVKAPTAPAEHIIALDFGRKPSAIEFTNGFVIDVTDTYFPDAIAQQA